MSYSAFFRTSSWQFPSGLIYLVGGLAYINYGLMDRPQFGFKEVSSAEFKATPVAYLQDPEHHRVKLPKVPGQSSVTERPPHPPSAHHH